MTAAASARRRRLAAVMLALVAGGCATPGTNRAPVVSATGAGSGGPAASAAGASAAAAAPAPGDETVRGVRFGASRAELLRAWPATQCKESGCEGAGELLGWPATFWIFQQPDGRWIARVSVVDASPGASGTSRNFGQLEAALRTRLLPATPAFEQGGNQLHWRIGAEARRQVVLRRCAPQQQCRGLPGNVVEVDFFEKEAAAAW